MFAGSLQGSHRVLTLILALVAVALTVVSVVLPSNRADALVAGSLTPTISSDQADYPPGGTVVLTGSSWQPNESVHIFVNDESGRTWSRDVDVTADESGAIRDEFQLPDWFVAQYSVKATGDQSGEATTSFTDASRVKLLGKSNPACTSGGGCEPDGYEGGTLEGWKELDKIPMKLKFVDTGTYPVVLSFDHASTSGRRIPGIQNLIDWEPVAGSGITLVGTPQLDSSQADIWTYTVTANVTQKDALLNFNAKLAAGSHDYPGGSLDVDSSNAGGVVQIIKPGVGPGTPDLAVTKSGPEFAEPGETITYTLNYQNRASAPTKGDGIQVTDVLPAGLTYVSGSCVPNTCAASGNEVIWDLGTLNPGDTGSVTFQARVSETASNGTVYTNFAQILSEESEPPATAGDNEDTFDTTIDFNRNPNADNDSLTTNEDNAGNVNVLSNDDDPDGDTLSVTNKTNGTNGTVSCTSAGVCTYTPNANFNGTDTFTYTVSDGEGGTATGTVNVTVNPVNDDPNANDDTANATEDGPDVDIDVLQNDTASPDTGETLSITSVTQPPTGQGSVSIIESGQKVRFDPHADFFGQTTFTYTISDGNGGTDTATVTVNVAATNDPPEITFTDPTGDTQTVDESVNQERTYSYNLDNTDGPNATVTESCGGATKIDTLENNSFKCIFPDGQSNYTVSVTANDQQASNNTASDSIEVTVNNVAPTANDDTASASEEGPDVEIDVLSNDTDPANGLGETNDPLTITNVTGPPSGEGSVTIINGGKTVLYSPNPNFEGQSTSFSYTISDGDGGTDTANVTINLAEVNDDPVISENGVTNDGPVNEGSPATITVTATDPDTPPSELLYSFDCNGDGDYDDPVDKGPQAANNAQCTYFDNGTDLVNVEVTDGAGGSDTGSTNVVVNNVDPSATFDATPNTINEGQGVNLSLTDVVDPGTADTHTYSFKCGDAAWTAFGASNTHSCPTTDDGNLVVKGQVRDDDGGLSPEYSETITINNVPPTVDPPAQVGGENQSSNEGQNKPFDVGSFTDPGADGPWSVTVDWGDGSPDDSFNAANPGNLEQKAHAYDDNGTYTVTVTVAENGANAPSGQANFQITVNNVSPTGFLGHNGPVNENDPVTVSFTGETEPSNADNNAGLRYAYNCDGSAFGTIPTYASLAGSDSSEQCTYPDNGNHTVRALIMDKDGGHNVYTTSFDVNNTAPRVTLLSGPETVKESTTVERTYSFTATDAGSDELTITVDCGDNGNLVDTNGASPGGTYEYDSATGAGSFKCIFPDGGPDNSTTSNVTVRATDDDGASDADNQIVIVTVENDNPQATFNAPASVNEGQNIDLSLTEATDPAGSNDTLEYRFDCGNGFGAWGASTTRSCPTTDNGNVTVKGQVRDEDGGLSPVYEKTVTVNNLPPRVVLEGPTKADEGQTKEYSFTVTDAGSSDTFTVEGDPTCGANGQLVDGSLQVTSTGGSFRCFFPDGDSTTNVEIQVRDDDGALDADSQRVVIVNVANVAPVLTPAADQNSNEGQNKPFDLGSFTDPGDDDLWTITVNWGDGSADTIFEAANPGTLAQKAHTYANDGNYTVTVTVDEDGGAASDSETFNVTVANVAPTVDLTGSNTANEGDTKKYEFTVTDPGDDTHTVDWDCGAGEKVPGSFTYDSTTKTGSFECRFPDGPVNTTVSVTVNDGDDTGNDSIQVSVANVAPTANDDQMTTTELKEVTGNLVDNDDDPGNDIDRASLEILSINPLNPTPAGPFGGVVTISNLLDGNVTYLPNRGFVDIDSFRYKICDDDGDCSSANVEVTVGPVDCNAQGVILGTPGADILRGTPGNDVICAFGGNDRIYAGAGDDLLVGDTGLDRMWGEGGNDVMRGGGQTDAMDAALGDDYISGDTGRDVIMARGGNDYIDLKDNSAGDAANGGAGTDKCKKDSGDKTVSCELR